MAAWAPMFFLVNVLTLAVKGRVEKQLSSDCRDFLYTRMQPTGYEDKDFHFICQSYNKKARYVTLYNTADRIPVYSAYTFKRSGGETCIDIPWMYEPQVKKSRDTTGLNFLNFPSYPLSVSTAIYICRYGRHGAFPSTLHTHEF